MVKEEKEGGGAGVEDEGGKMTTRGRKYGARKQGTLRDGGGVKIQA